MVLCMFNYMDVNYKIFGLCLVLILIKLYNFFFKKKNINIYKT